MRCWRSGSPATDSIRRRVSSSRTTSPSAPDSRSSSTKSPSSELPSSEERGWLRLVASGMALLTSLTRSTSQPILSATSSSVDSRWLALELGRKLVVGAGHLPYLLAHVHGHPYGPPLVGDSPLDGLPDPPGGVGGEAEAFLG